jgi:glycerate kinase
MPGQVVCAPDKLRGSLSAEAAAAALARGVRRAGRTADACPVADGGEGTLAVLVAAGLATPVAVEARDPLGRPRTAHIGELCDGAFLIEVAEAAGLSLLALCERDPLRADTAGVADLVRAALERGARRLVVGLGGTATVDAGAGMLGALGVTPPGSLGVELDVLYDVDVPLSGPDGAVRLFGPQKGVRPDQVAALDEALARRAATYGPGVAERPGAGAAGGLGAALYSLGGRGRSGAEAILELLGLERRLQGAALCLTAEGAVDRSSARGKAVAAVVRAAQRAGVPCAVIGGRVDAEGAEAMRRLGAVEVRALGPSSRRLEIAAPLAAEELESAAWDLARA